MASCPPKKRSRSAADDQENAVLFSADTDGDTHDERPLGETPAALADTVCQMEPAAHLAPAFMATGMDTTKVRVLCKDAVYTCDQPLVKLTLVTEHATKVTVEVRAKCAVLSLLAAASGALQQPASQLRLEFKGKVMMPFKQLLSERAVPAHNAYEARVNKVLDGRLIPDDFYLHGSRAMSITVASLQVYVVQCLRYLVLNVHLTAKGVTDFAPSVTVDHVWMMLCMRPCVYKAVCDALGAPQLIDHKPRFPAATPPTEVDHVAEYTRVCKAARMYTELFGIEPPANWFCINAKATLVFTELQFPHTTLADYGVKDGDFIHVKSPAVTP